MNFPFVFLVKNLTFKATIYFKRISYFIPFILLFSIYFKNIFIFSYAFVFIHTTHDLFSARKSSIICFFFFRTFKSFKPIFNNEIFAFPKTTIAPSTTTVNQLQLVGSMYVCVFSLVFEIKFC